MSDPEYIGRIARSIAPCGLVCALCGKPSCKGCRAFLFVPPAYMLPGERLLRMLGMPAFSLRGGHVFLCAEQQQTPYRLCALRAGGRRRRACVVSGRQ